MMHRRVKTVIAVLCVTFMVAAMLAGCKGNATPSEGSSSTTPAANSATEASKAAEANSTAEASSAADPATDNVPMYPLVDEPITITVAVFGQDMTNPRTTWQALEELTNVHFEFVNVEKDQRSVYYAGNEWPDLFTEIQQTALYDYGVLGGRFVDYTQYKDIMPNLWKMFEEWPDAYKCSVQNNGAIYSVPRIEKTLTITMSRQHYRSDITDAAGVEKMPETPEELYDALVKCRDYLGGQAPMVAYNTDIIFPAFGDSMQIGYYDDGTGKVGDNRVEQQYRDFLSYMNKLYEEGLLHQEYLTMDGNSKQALFNEGKAAFTDNAGSIQKADFMDGEWHIESMKPLVKQKGDTPICVTPGYVQAATFFAINAESPYVEEICKIVDIAFATEEVQEGTGLCGLAFNYGPVGVNLIIIDDETYKIQNADASDINSADLGKVAFYGYSGYNYNTRIAAGDTNLAARSRAWRDNVIPYAVGKRMPSLDYYLKPTDDEMVIYEEYFVGLKSYSEEMRDKFIMGLEDVNDDAVWEKYCQGMKDAGLEELLEVYQAAYDRYNAN